MASEEKVFSVDETFRIMEDSAYQGMELLLDYLESGKEAYEARGHSLRIWCAAEERMCTFREREGLPHHPFYDRVEDICTRLQRDRDLEDYR